MNSQQTAAALPGLDS